MAYGISNILNPAQSALNSKLNPNPLGQLQSANTKLAATGLGKGLAVAPLATPKTSLPAGAQAGGVISSTQYNALPKTASAPSVTPSGLSAPPTGSNVTAPLSQSQLDAQNALQGKTQFNTAPATSGVSVAHEATGTAPTGYSQTNPPTYSGLVGSLANTAGGTSAASGLIQKLGSGQNSPGLEQAIQDQNRLQQAYNQSLHGERSGEGQGIEQGFVTGRQAAIEKTYGGQQLAAQQKVSNLLGAQGQQLNALGTATGAANTAQGLQQSGLSSAAGYAAPILGQYGQANYGIGGNTSGEVQQSDPFYKTLESYAQMAASGQYSSIPSNITSNSVLNDQMNQMAKKINPSYNPITSAAQGDVLGSIPALTAANTAAEGIKNQIQSFLTQNPQLNPSDTALANAAQQWIQGKQLTDPKYQTLFNYLAEYTNTLAPILGVGGDATNLKTEIAQGFINAHASGKSISEVLNSIESLASQKIKNLQSGATGGGVVNGSSSGGTIVQTSAGAINTDW